jgi:ABC-2 type transport system permease protein
VSAAAEVKLVAEREIRQRVRTRAFQVSTGLFVLGAIVAVVLSRTLGDDGPPKPLELGVVGAAPAGIGRSPVELRTRRLPNEDAARAALRSGTIDLALVGSARLLVRSGPEEGSRLAAAAASIAAAAGTRSALDRAGVPPATVRGALADARPIPIRATEPTKTDDDEETGVAFLAALILYLALIFAGYAVATGVVEEKTSRVVEILLTALRPSRLLAGKVIGIGLTGLAQLAAAAVPLVIALLVLDADALPSGSARAIGWSLVWFALGYLLYASAYATAGVLAGRQEDTQTVTMPVTAVLVVSYLVSINVASVPDGALATVTSIFPLSAPMVMPVRIATESVPAWQIAVSVVLTAVATVALIALAARIYRGAFLRVGARTRLGAAWRAGAA